MKTKKNKNKSKQNHGKWNEHKQIQWLRFHLKTNKFEFAILHFAYISANFNFKLSLGAPYSSQYGMKDKLIDIWLRAFDMKATK